MSAASLFVLTALADNPDYDTGYGGGCTSEGSSFANPNGTGYASYSYTYSQCGACGTRLESYFWTSEEEGWEDFVDYGCEMTTHNWYLYAGAVEGWHQVTFPWSPNFINGHTYAP